MKLNLMGAETGKQKWHALLFFVWPRFVYFVFSYLTVFCVCMPGFRMSWEDVGGRSYRNIRIRRTHSSTRHPRILFGTCRVTWGLLSQTRASWTGLASFDQGSSSLAACYSIKEQCVGIAESSKHNDNRQEQACGVVGCSPSPELEVCSYRYIPGYRVRGTERVHQ